MRRKPAVPQLDRYRNWSLHLLALVANSHIVSSSNLPYNPARVLYSPKQTGKYVYVLQPGDDSTKSAEFASIDLTESQDASSLSLNLLASDLPFLSPSASVAYTTVIGPAGNITVFAGTCAAVSPGASSVWRFTPDAQAHNGNGTWARDTVSSTTSEPLTGANYLSAGISFSPLSDPTDSSMALYYFAGMCPHDDADSSASAWAGTADYSDLMISLRPQQSIMDDVDYKLAIISATGPPIAEAGFSITALSPTYSNASDGTQTQQQDFVLMGGHTQTAFINMSQVAIFSLPQAVWSFLPVDQPSRSASEKRSSLPEKVSPRSGHTAVISEDGRSIVVFGGWVGNVSTPATPQLAIVSLGLGFGGDGDWVWAIPDQPAGPNAPDTAMYGHGAAMLPGNVMMVVGGYGIGGSATTLSKRGSTSRAHFYNVSSNTWMSSYSSSSVPNFSGHQQGTKAGALSTASQRAALAIGIILAVILLAGSAVFALWYKRRAQRQQNARDSLTQALVGEKEHNRQRMSILSSASGSPEKYPELDPYNEDSTNSKGQFPWLPDVSANMHRQLEADCTGAYRNIPSPTRGLRKSSACRAFSYTPAPMPEERRAIHMIEERDEEASLRSRSEAQEQRRIAAVRDTFGPNLPRPVTAASDPFMDPRPDPLGSHPVSPEIDQRSSGCVSPSKFGHNSVTIHKDQIATWVNSWSAPHHEMHELHSSTGRLSPSKYTERTGSNLSESSAYSIVSSSRSTAHRPASSRSSAPYPVLMQESPGKDDRAFSFNRDKAPENLTHSRSIRTSPVRTVTRQISPKRSFARLRSEGAALLHGDSKRPPSSIYSDKEAAAAAEANEPMIAGGTHHQPRSQPSSPKKAGWMGSIKRVFGTVSDRSFSANEPMSQVGIERSYTTNPSKSTATTPNRRPPPRRTASESSAFLRTRQGKHDWENGSERKTAWEPYDNTPDMGVWGGPTPPSPPPPVPHHRLLPGLRPVTGSGYRRPVAGRKAAPSVALTGSKADGDDHNDSDGDDWDVEQAAAGRDFQVMFTVPKARLRVVNADVDRLSQRSVSDEKKRPRSVASVRSQRSAVAGAGGDNDLHAM